MLTTELETQVETKVSAYPNLTRAGVNFGNKGGGAPKLRVRKGAAAGAERAQKILLSMLDDHESGKAVLTATEAKNIYEAMSKIGVGELKEVSLEKDDFLEALSDVLGSTEGLDDDLAVRIYDATVARCNDS